MQEKICSAHPNLKPPATYNRAGDNGETINTIATSVSLHISLAGFTGFTSTVLDHWWPHIQTTYESALGYTPPGIHSNCTINHLDSKNPKLRSIYHHTVTEAYKSQKVPKLAKKIRSLTV
jgi:hypothetical protein